MLEGWEAGMRVFGSPKSVLTYFGLCAGVAALMALVILTGATAGTATNCTTIELCYCVNQDYRSQIDANIARVLQLIDDQRNNQGKAIGYMSIPLSTVGGSYMNLNMEIARKTKDRLEERFGKKSVWILNPGAEGNLHTLDSGVTATGADYMYMWTRILEGTKGLGENFDFFYFVGPSNFREFFGLNGVGDMEKIDAYFDKEYATGNDFKGDFRKAVDDKKLSKRTFRDYYALRASVEFSYGSHDEWNIARIVNERRRGAEEFGIANQLAILFGGRAAAPGSAEAPIASGDVGRCIN
jgi:hypothetical protein